MTKPPWIQPARSTHDVIRLQYSKCLMPHGDYLYQQGRQHHSDRLRLARIRSGQTQRETHMKRPKDFLLLAGIIAVIIIIAALQHRHHMEYHDLTAAHVQTLYIESLVRATDEAMIAG